VSRSQLDEPTNPADTDGEHVRASDRRAIHWARCLLSKPAASSCGSIRTRRRRWLQDVATTRSSRLREVEDEASRSQPKAGSGSPWRSISPTAHPWLRELEGQPADLTEVERATLEASTPSMPRSRRTTRTPTNCRTESISVSQKSRRRGPPWKPDRSSTIRPRWPAPVFISIDAKDCCR